MVAALAAHGPREDLIDVVIAVANFSVFAIRLYWGRQGFFSASGKGSAMAN